MCLHVVQSTHKSTNSPTGNNSIKLETCCYLINLEDLFACYTLKSMQLRHFLAHMVCRQSKQCTISMASSLVFNILLQMPTNHMCLDMFQHLLNSACCGAMLDLLLLVQLIAGDDVMPSASQDLDSVDVAAAAAAVETVSHEPNEYETQRQRNIERNRQMLLDLKRKDLQS